MKKIFLLVFTFCTIVNCYSQSSQEYFKNGIAKIDLEDYRGAIADFNKSIELNPNDSIAYYNRGIAKNELQDRRGAITDTAKIELDSNNLGIYHKEVLLSTNSKTIKVQY